MSKVGDATYEVFAVGSAAPPMRADTVQDAAVAASVLASSGRDVRIVERKVTEVYRYEDLGGGKVRLHEIGEG